MRLLIFGPPGAGKGTQAQYVATHFRIPHVSTGDIFRANMRDDTPLGREARTYAERGELVPDAVTNAMVEQRLAETDCAGGFLLDGYPRTVDQADALDRVLAARDTELDAVINLIVPDGEIVERLAKRGRADDARETVERRLHVYHETTKPLIGRYRAQSVLRDVEGVGAIDEITARILRALGRNGEPS
jgi:adenylate kinase